MTVHLKSLFLVLVVSATAACTSSTSERVNKITLPQPNAANVEQHHIEQGLKRLVAIGRFSDETKRANGFLFDNNNNRLGKQASDILSSRLTSTGKFIMLERPDIQVLQQESASFEQSKIGADYLIIGSVSEFGRRTESEVGVFSRNKIQIANATVNIRLVDVKTGQIIYTEEASGESRSEANQVLGVGQVAAYDTSLDDKAISAAISKLVANVINNLMDKPWQAYFLKGDDNTLYMTGGSDQGIKVGDQFNIALQGKPVRNPQTGFVINLPDKVVGTIAITGFIGSGNDQLSLIQIIDGQVDANNLQQYKIKELGANNNG